MDTSDSSNLQPNLQENLQDKASGLADQATQAVKGIGEKADCWLRKSRECIEKRPIICVVAGVVVGALLARLIFSGGRCTADKT